MDEKGIQEWRQQRLQALADKFQGKAELGRKLGYRDGAYVGQMIAGLRPITEKLIGKAEALPGCRAWFTKDAPTVEPKGAVFEALSSEEKELLSHWRRLLGKDRRAKLKVIAALAKEREAQKAELFEMAGVTAIAERAANASRNRTARSSVEPNGALRQRSLIEEESKK